MWVVGIIFYPLVVLLNSVATVFLRLLRIPVDSERRFYTPNELELLVQESHEQGLLPSKQQEIIRNIFDFGERDLHQLMTPRVRIKGLAVDSSPEDIWALIESSQHSRLPVFENDLDHIVGILHIKDFLKQQRGEPPFDLRALARDAPFIAETAKAETLLATFKRLKVHMAVVTDEYGGTAGVVTLDDLLEEVIGEVDSSSSSPFDLEVQPDGSFLLRGDLLIEEFLETTGVPLSPKASDTMAGLLLEMLDRAPQVGDQVAGDQVTLVVEAVEGLVITRIRAFVADQRK